MTESTDESLGSLGSALRKLAAAPMDLLVRGVVVDGQYQIDRVIGHGAMGVVYLAKDLRLERNVALKLAREQSPVALVRASREAVSLARLQHPNVVAIHQVGEHEGRVYAAMEYVAGVTARGWLQTERSVREIIALYVEVGEGLAAAHAAGLVHRDFKPDNVLVGEDGRVRVADFGLARVSIEPVPGAEPADPTATAIAGTPAYMAPEQYRGGDIDARADQFAFCTSIWEALHRTRPFPGESAETICDAIETGDPRRGPPEAVRKIPRHIELALRRGLSRDRDQRWPSLAPLLAELRRDPSRRRRRVALGIVVPALAAVGIFAATRSAGPVDPCAGGSARLASLWSPQRGTAVQAAIAPTGAPAWVTAVASAAVSSTDQWTERWVTTYRAVCEAAWTPALHDRGSQCLARGEHALRATVEDLVEPGADPTKIDAVIRNLPRPEVCADPLYLEAIKPPPTDPAVARGVALVEEKLLRVGIFAAAGRLDRAKALVTELDTEPQPAHPPLIAQIHYIHARLTRWSDDNAKAAPELEASYFEARAVGDRALAAHSAVEATMSLLDLSRDADAEHWSKLAEVEVGTLADPELEAAVLDALCVVATSRNEPERGGALCDRALRLARSSRDTQTLVLVLRDRAAAYEALGKYDLALADLDEATQTIHARYGAVHPLLSTYDAERSTILVKQGHIPEAIAAGRRALEIAELVGTKDSVVVNFAVGALGVALSHAHQYPEALEMLDRSLATDRSLDGARSYNVASDLNNRCDLLAQMNRNDDAIADGKLAIEIWTEVVSKDASEIGVASFNLASALLGAKRYAEARTAADQAVAIMGKQPDSPTLGLPLTIRGVAQHWLGHRVEARADLEHAIAVLADKNPEWLAGAKLELAKLEFDERNLGPAKLLAVTARDSLKALGDPRLADAELVVSRVERCAGAARSTPEGQCGLIGRAQ